MAKSPRRNIYFRQTAREFKSAASARIYGRIQRIFPYSRYHIQKIWTIVSKPAKIPEALKSRFMNRQGNDKRLK